MGLDSPAAREQLELELVREVVLARRKLDSTVLAALTLGAELLEHTSERATAMRAARILEQFAIDEVAVARDPRGALRADLARDHERAKQIGLEPDDPSAEQSEQDRRRQQQAALLCEVRADLLDVVAKCRKFRLDRVAFDEEIAQGLCAATDKLVIGADMDTYQAWQRGMVLKLIEEPVASGPPRVMATVDAGPGRGQLTVEWDSCERRLALVARMARAGVAPVVICDRLLADLSVSSPLRYSVR
ncbi:hypothetical protein F5X71_02945 [Nocardia brasiliensis]|uniref:Uncharacterized protein n=1 Tax=Nocardia brasiliensis TaxID=37326 RepID=A0A6G9XKH0_NOCBR|nr:hypothetical protein [Nocardia brasiliensis]QIS01407.1 hypothetical protein F5X71_02945 [Nocardia brasiliensis]